MLPKTSILSPSVASIRIAVLALILTGAHRALAGHITVDFPTGNIQSSAFARDYYNSLSSDSPPNNISFGGSADPFNMSVVASASATATANSTASQNWHYSLINDSLDLSASGGVSGGANSGQYLSSGTTAYSNFHFNIYSDVDFTYSLSISTTLNTGGTVQSSSTEVTFGGNQPFAFAGINGGHPGEPPSASFSGTLPAGIYSLDAPLNMTMQSLATGVTDSGTADYTVIFHAALAPEPSSAVLLAVAGGSLILRRRSPGR